MFLKDKNNFSVTSSDKLNTARTINGTSFNGSANITTSLWGTARTLTIGSTGKSVNGSANVSWTLSEIGAAAASHTHNYAGSSSAGGAATSANKVNTNLIVKLNGGATEGTNLFTFNGSAAKTVNITASSIGAAASSHTHSYLPLSGGTLTGSVKNSLNTGTWLAGNQGTALLSSTNTAGNFTTLIKSNSTNGYFGLSNYQNSFYLTYTAKTTVDAGTNTTTKQAVLLNESGNTTFPGTVTAPTFSGALSGNATTATTLQTARTINGTSFNGSANITTANWGTARTLKVGNTGKSVNGSANITWTLAEIGALGAKTANGYEGMTTSGGSDSSWIRTTSSGIIPYSSNTAGTSSLGTSSWPFANVYTRALATSKIEAYSFFDNSNADYSGFAVHFKGTDAIYGAYDFTGLYLYFDTFLGYTGFEIKDPSNAVEIWGGDYFGKTFSGSATAKFAGILPHNNKNNTYSLGNSSYRWSDVYCTRGSFNGSDKSLKEDIKKISSSQTRENSSDYVTSEDLYNHVKNSSTYTFRYKGTEDHVMGVIANEIPDNIFNLLGKMSKTEEEYQQEKDLEDSPKIKERYKALKEHGEYDKEGKEDRIDRETGLTYSEIKSIAEGNYTPEAPVRLLNPASQVAMLQEVLSMSLNKIEQLEERIKVLEENK